MLLVSCSAIGAGVRAGGGEQSGDSGEFAYVNSTSPLAATTITTLHTRSFGPCSYRVTGYKINYAIHTAYFYRPARCSEPGPRIEDEINGIIHIIYYHISNTNAVRTVMRMTEGEHGRDRR